MIWEIIAIAGLVAWVWWRVRRGFLDGMCLAVTLLLCLPTYLRITLPQPFPALTIHRLILLVLLLFWLRDESLRRNVGSALMKKAFVFFAVASGLSLLFTEISFISSLKDYLDFVFEIFVFFLVVSTAVRDRDSAVRLLRAVWLGFVIVGILAVIERYTGFNPVERFISGFVQEEKGRVDVVSTFPHRILLGTGMAMAWPIAYALILFQAGELKISPSVLWASAMLFLSACYFAMSRGPWLAAVIGGAVLAVVGSGIIRRRLLAISAIMVLVLIARPGVLGTFTGKAEETADVDSLKGGTFLYRLELWKIAWIQVSTSPVRMFVGYGLGAGRETDLSWDLSYRDKAYVIDSWDNHFAYDLYQSGLLGLAASLTLHCGAGLILFRLWRKGEAGERDVLACCLASVSALVFMMTNVLIFAKQLNFAFWSIFAAGVAYSGYYQNWASQQVSDEERSLPERAGAEANTVEPTLQKR